MISPPIRGTSARLSCHSCSLTLPIIGRLEALSSSWWAGKGACLIRDCMGSDHVYKSLRLPFFTFCFRSDVSPLTSGNETSYSYPTTMAYRNRTPGESALVSLSEGDAAAAAADANFGSDSSEISTRSSIFRQEVCTLIDGDIQLSSFADRAKAMIAMLASHDSYNQISRDYTSKAMIDVKPHRILDSMLHYAEGCGGEYGKQYAAAAICACSHQENKETLKYLQSLATTWLSHLLYVCQRRLSAAKHTYDLVQNSQGERGSYKPA